MIFVFILEMILKLCYQTKGTLYCYDILIYELWLWFALISITFREGKITRGNKEVT